MTTHERSAAGNDRERRAALETLQVELREAKQALALVDGAEAPELAALRAAATRAAERRAEADAHRARLTAERERLEAEAARLNLEIRDERVVPRGRSKSYSSADWDRADPSKVRLFALIGGAVVLGMFLLGECARHL